MPCSESYAAKASESMATKVAGPEQIIDAEIGGKVEVMGSVDRSALQ